MNESTSFPPLEAVANTIVYLRRSAASCYMSGTNEHKRIQTNKCKIRMFYIYIYEIQRKNEIKFE